MGYLVNQPSGLTGYHGFAYDYILAKDGIYVQAKSTLISARLLHAPAPVRGLNPTEPKFELANGPIPNQILAKIMTYFQLTAPREAFAAICWDGARYQLILPIQTATPTSLAYIPTNNAVAEFHSHPTTHAFFSATDDRDEQGFRAYGVLGNLLADKPQLALRAGIYGHYAPLTLQDLFAGQTPPHPTLPSGH